MKHIQCNRHIFIFMLVVMLVVFHPFRMTAQNVGIGTAAFIPVNRLDVKGNAVIGNTYSGVSVAPVNGLLIEGNTGIGIVAPTEKLDVVGNVKFSGALMPANLAGTAGQVLKSAGGGVAPVWGPQMGGITAVERWYLGPQTFNANTTTTFTITGVTGCTTASIVQIVLAGTWATQPNVTIHHIEARNTEIRFRISNNTFLTNYTGMDFNVIVIR
ncbi:MAG: hypothetical protein ABI763_15695 [Bacteroidota bacterium]